jgi:Divergent InlB B-repeat domain
MRRFLCVLLILVLLFGLQAISFGAVDAPVIATRAGEFGVTGTSRWVSWTRSAPGSYHANVMAKRWGSSPFRVNASGTEGSDGQIVGNKLIYQQYRARRNISDLYVFDLQSRSRRKLGAPSTRHWEYLPKASEGWLLFVRLNLRTGVRQVILMNRRTGGSRVLDQSGPRGYLQPGQVSGPFAVWMHLSGGKPSRIHVYRIGTRDHRVIPSNRWDWAPSVTPEGTVYFGRTWKTCGSSFNLMRMPWGGNTSVVKSFRDGLDSGGTSTYYTPEGHIKILYERARCSSPRWGSDIYRYSDDFAVKLTVVRDFQGNSSGTVRSRQSGINCGSDCSQFYEPVPGNTVTLIATPAAGDSFQGWDHPNCPGTGPCTVPITDAVTVTASFGP